jgi:hypothetical protein
VLLPRGFAAVLGPLAGIGAIRACFGVVTGSVLVAGSALDCCVTFDSGRAVVVLVGGVLTCGTRFGLIAIGQVGRWSHRDEAGRKTPS